MPIPFPTYAYKIYADPSFGPAAVERTTGVRFADQINIRELGAVPDGTFNNTPVWQNAADMAYGAWNGTPHGVSNKFSNRVIVIPNGNYKFEDTVYFRDVQGGGMIGEGMESTTLSFEYQGVPGNAMITSGAGSEASPLFMFDGCAKMRIGNFYTGSNNATAAASTVAFYIFTRAGGAYSTANDFFNILCNNYYVGCYGGYGGNDAGNDNMQFHNVHWNDCGLAGIRVFGQNALNWGVYGGGAAGCAAASTIAPPDVGNAGAGYSIVGGTLSPIIGASMSANKWDICSGGGNMMTIIGGSSESHNFLFCAGNAHVSGLAFRGYQDGTFIDVSGNGKVISDICQYNPSVDLGTGAGKIANCGNGGTVVFRALQLPLSSWAGADSTLVGTPGSRVEIHHSNFAPNTTAPWVGYTGELIFDGGAFYRSLATNDTVSSATSPGTFVHFAALATINRHSLGAGVRVRGKAVVQVSTAGAGTSALACSIRIGGFGTWGTVALTTSTAIDPTANGDVHVLEFELTSREQPSTTSSLTGDGEWLTNTGGTVARGVSFLPPTDFDTTEWLEIGVWAQWASNNSSVARLETFALEYV